MLYAPTGLGKTMLSMSVALAVAGGGRVLDWEVSKPRRVLIVDGEMPMWELVRRARFLSGAISGLDPQAVEANLHILARQHQHPDAVFPDLGTEEGREEVLRRAREGGFDLIILDNFSTLVDVADENDAAAMSPVLAFLMRAKQAGIACLLVHHSGKSGETYRGSSRLATTFEVIIGLRKPEGERKGTDAEFDLVWEKCRARRTEATRGKRLWLAEGAAGVAQWCFELSQDEEITALLAAVRSGRFRTQRELGRHLGWDAAKVTRRKGKAIADRLTTKDEWDRCLAGDEENWGETAEEEDFDL